MRRETWDPTARGEGMRGRGPLARGGRLGSPGAARQGIGERNTSCLIGPGLCLFRQRAREPLLSLASARGFNGM